MLTTTDLITSEATPHVARRITLDEIPGSWALTWWPGHALTLDQAKAGMAIAQTVGEHPLPSWSPLWPALTAWAAALGLAATDAVALAARVDGDGPPCPDWCAGIHPPITRRTVTRYHHRSTRTLTSAGIRVEVLATWREDLDGQQSGPPLIEIQRHDADSDPARPLSVDLGPADAAALAAVLGGLDPATVLQFASGLADGAALLDFQLEPQDDQ